MIKFKAGDIVRRKEDYYSGAGTIEGPMIGDIGIVTEQYSGGNFLVWFPRVGEFSCAEGFLDTIDLTPLERAVHGLDVNPCSPDELHL